METQAAQVTPLEKPPVTKQARTPPKFSYILYDNRPWIFTGDHAALIEISERNPEYGEDPIEYITGFVKNVTVPKIQELAWAFSFWPRQKYADLPFVSFCALLPIGEELIQFRDELISLIVKMLPRAKEKKSLAIPGHLENGHGQSENITSAQSSEEVTPIS